MASDITPPVLQTISLSDVLIDMGIGEDSFVVTAHLTDELDGSGIAILSFQQMRFVSPSGQFINVSFDLDPVSGTRFDGLYEATVHLGTFAAAGPWTTDYMVLRDEAVNTAFLNPGNSPPLAALSFAVVNPNSDIAPINLQSISLNDTVIDMDSGESSFVVTAHLTDNLSGVALLRFQQMTFLSPHGQFINVNFDLDPVSGTRLNGDFQATVHLGAFADAGTWTLQTLILNDEAGNSTVLNPANSTLVQQTTFQVKNSASDLTAPELKSLDIGTPTLKADGTSEFTITARLTDSGSGVAAFPYNQLIRFVSSTGQFTDGVFDYDLVSGNRFDGVYKCIVTLGAFAEAGAWTVQSMNLQDDAGNRANLTPATTPALVTAVIMLGSALGDAIDGTPSADAIFSYSGDDSLHGLAGNDTLNGGDGDDRVNGGGGGDLIVGGSGAGDDRYVGGAGHDTVVYKSAVNGISVNLETGKAKGADIGKDILKSIEGVVGGHGNDKLTGGSGKDTLDGFSGADRLTGGESKDRFLFDTALDGINVDRITDFAPKSDKIQLAHGIFSTIDLGALSGDAFAKGKNLHAAKDAEDRIVYDKKSGALFFDADGVGGEAARLFAMLNGSPDSLSHKDFLVLA